MLQNASPWTHKPLATNKQVESTFYIAVNVTMNATYKQCFCFEN